MATFVKRLVENGMHPQLHNFGNENQSKHS